jgi:hypothetical protein
METKDEDLLKAHSTIDGIWARHAQPGHLSLVSLFHFGEVL